MTNHLSLLQLIISLSPLSLLGAVIICLGGAFFITRDEIATFQKEITDLENEILESHNEILKLEKEKARLMKQVADLTAHAEEKHEQLLQQVPLSTPTQSRPLHNNDIKACANYD